MKNASSGGNLNRFLSRFTKTAEPLQPVVSVAQVLYRLAEMETEAAGYYDGLAKHSNEPWVREFAAKVAKGEREHQKLFLRQARALDANDPGHGADRAIPEEVRALMSTGITLSKESAPRTAAYLGDKDAVELAIAAEEKAIRLLCLLRDYVPAEQHGIINQVLQEEIMHKTSLEKLFSKIFG